MRTGERFAVAAFLHSGASLPDETPEDRQRLVRVPRDVWMGHTRQLLDDLAGRTDREMPRPAQANA